MLILVGYDVNTMDHEGQRRLRLVSKCCQDYGQRVQNSLFECVVDSTQFASLKHRLLRIIDLEKDSVRFYQLGKNYKSKVEHYGIKQSIDLEGTIII